MAKLIKGPRKLTKEQLRKLRGGVSITSGGSKTVPCTAIFSLNTTKPVPCTSLVSV